MDVGDISYDFERSAMILRDHPMTIPV